MFQRLFILIICIFCFIELKASETKIINLKTEYEVTPIGIDVAEPRFSWNMGGATFGDFQKAYQITVSDESGRTVWDTGKTSSNESLHIKYQGKQLHPRTRYVWKLKVWDQKNKIHHSSSWFETGFLDPRIDAWDGAKWIGGSDQDLVLYSQYLPVFKVDLTIQIDEASQSSKVGFVYGANDERLMDNNKNIFLLENQRDQSYVLMELDISPIKTGKNALLKIYRVGYSPKDISSEPLKQFEIPQEIINAKNQYEPHKIYIHSNLGHTDVFVNEEKKTNHIGYVGLNPNGNGGDYISFPVLADIGIHLEEYQVAQITNVTVRNFRAPSNILFEGTLTRDQPNGNFLKTIDPSRNSSPMLRTAFEVKAKVSKARLYVTARGIYEIQLNGEKVGEDFFNPGFTQYNKTLFYQTYDITDQIQEGKNGLGAILSEGWWSGASTYMGEYWNFFGDRQSLLAKLVITYADGSIEEVNSNPETWKYYSNGPTSYSSMFQGEVYDANKEAEIKGWSTGDFDDAGWSSSVEVPLSGTTNTDPASGNVPSVADHDKLKIIGQYGTNVKAIQEVSAQSFEEVRPGVYVYDLGQNFAGVPKIMVRETLPNQKIYLRFAEVKYPQLDEYGENQEMIMLENIRAAMAQDVYIAKGGEALISPKFTFHGFRYIEITGLKSPLPLEDVKAQVLSSVHELASSYQTSNPLVNKLWENITWSTYSNFLSIPTDCPQRNERLGWSGDISVFAPTANFLSNIPQFLRRHLLAMRDVQTVNGRFPDVAPLGVGFGEMMWGSAGITVPWESYKQYNDIDLLEEHYPSMIAYMDYLLGDINAETGVFKEDEKDVWGSLGDWLSLEDSNNEKLLFWEAYLIYNLDLMTKMAQVLGQKEDMIKFSMLSESRKDFFNNTYFDAETGKTKYQDKLIDTQASYALPLAFEIVKKDILDQVIDNFANSITRKSKTDQGIDTPPFSLMTGFIGTAWICKALSDHGLDDLAYRLLQQKEYPSWIYPVEQGATTVWERLNSYTHTNGFDGNNNMNSFNHYAFGAVGAWMYGYSLGIKVNEANPGFRQFELAPTPDPSNLMTFAKGHYDSMYGRIESAWTKTDKGVNYSFQIPANTSAKIILHASESDQVLINGKDYKKNKFVSLIEREEGKLIFEAKAGTYSIEINQ